MRIFSSLLLAGAMLFLAGCGEGDSSDHNESSPKTSAENSPKAAPAARGEPLKRTRLAITLDGYAGPQNLGVLMAVRRGYFGDVGLAVQTYIPASPDRPIRYVTDRVIDLSISREPQVVLAAENGTPVVALASLVAQPTAAMIWLEDSQIGDLGDLEGKTVAIPGLPFQRLFLDEILEREGLTSDDVKVKSVGYDLVSALINGKADAIFGGSGSLEGVDLESRGMEPVITPVQDLGIPAYDELVLIARADRVAEDPRIFRAFLTALKRGTAAAIEDPAAAAAVVEESIEDDPDVEWETTEAQVEATLPLLSEDGYMDPEQADQLVEWMKDRGMIGKKVPSQAFLHPTP